MAVRPAPVRKQRGSEIVSLKSYIADPDDDWDDIAQRPSEPNSFAERWFMEASVRNLDPPSDARMLVVREEGQLIGLMPLTIAPRYGRTPVRHVENWLHFNSFFGAPLVRRSFEPFFWHRALELLDGDPDAPAFLHVVTLDEDGPLTRTLLAARRGAAIVHRSRRAMLRSALSSGDYYDNVVRKKKRKEIGRLRSRLAEQGSISFSHLPDSTRVDAWIEAFLHLEASGWKGREGSALANEAHTAAFTRDALHGAWAAGRLDMLRLDLDGQAIAMLVNFFAPPGGFSFKIAFDEAFARFSPGVLIQIANLKLLDRRDIDWMDSCAVEDHPMINSLWSERRSVVRVSVPLSGWRRRAAFSVCRTLENASSLFRGLR